MSPDRSQTFVGRLFALALVAAPSVAGCDVEAPPSEPAASPPEEAAGSPGKLTVVKAFTCEPAAIRGDTPIVELPDMPGERLILRPSNEDCQFDLVVQSDSGHDSVLTASPGGYLFAAGVTPPAAPPVFCASNIRHGSVSGRAAEEHAIDGVDIECSVKKGGRWTPLATIVDADESWAAWVNEVVFDPELGLYRVVYVRDFSFQFLNTSDNGRPETDGVYQVAFSSDLVALETDKLSDKTVGDGDLTVVPWDGK